MQFQVPQFIEIEDKIFGPLTFKQFIYLAGGVGASIVLWLYIPYKIIGDHSYHAGRCFCTCARILQDKRQNIH